VNPLTVITLMIMAAVVAWGVTLAHASRSLSKFRAEVARREAALRREMQDARDDVARARSHAAQVTRDAATWVAGCKQGRDDVISVVPLLIAARQGEPDGGDDTCREHAPQKVAEHA
jgi:hypothetical protein